MVQVVNIPATPRGGGGGGAGIAGLIGMAMRKGQDKRRSKEVQDYIDQLEKVKAEGGSRKEAADIEVPAFLLKDNQGIAASMGIQNSIFGSTEQDKLTAFFDKDGKFMADAPRSQRPEGGQTLAEFNARATSRAGFKPTEADKTNAAMFRREMTRRGNLGLDTDAKARGQLRGAIRVWNASEKQITSTINSQYGKADPSDPNKWIYDTEESRKQAITARQNSFEHFVRKLDEAPTISESLAQGISQTGERARRPEPPAQEKKPSPLEALGKTISEMLGGEEEPAAAPEETKVPTVSFGTVDGREISVPQGMTNAVEIRDYLIQNENLSQDQAIKAVQDYSKPFEKKKDEDK